MSAVTEAIDSQEKPTADMIEDPSIKPEALAHLANHEDHELGRWASLKKHPWACLWCVYSVWCVLLVSFDQQAAGNVTSIPQFRQDFGYWYENDYVLETKWQSAFSGAPVASAVVGALCGGQIADWIGRKKTITLCIVISFAAITMEFVATSSEMFFGGKFLNGFPLGALASVPVTYVGETAPLALRGTLTCLTALAYSLGPLVVALITNWTGTYTTRWAYRAVFCAQYGFAAIAAIFVFFLPESPWWLVSKSKEEAAAKSLKGLGYSAEEVPKKLSAIKLTLDEIRKETEGVTYLECFRRSNLRRTIISIMPLTIQAMSGVIFTASYATYYMQLAGYSTAMSFKLQIAQQVMSLTGNIMSWFFVDRVGRRNIMFYGLFVLTIILFVTGGLAVAAMNGSASALTGAVAMIMVYSWWYNVTIGAAGYTVLAEVATARLRVKTIAIGMATQNAIFTMWNFVMPYLFNPDRANLGARVAFIFGGFSIICLVYLWFYQPETAGRTYSELDEMFVKKVSARKFKAFKTDTESRGEAVKVLR